jgi:hypothetical protein
MRKLQEIEADIKVIGKKCADDVDNMSFEDAYTLMELSLEFQATKMSNVLFFNNQSTKKGK